MLYLYHFTVLCAYKGRSVVAVAEVAAHRIGQRSYECRTVDRLCVHGYKGFHAVAAMDVQSLCNRSESMGGIYVATMAHIVVQTPSEFVVLSVFPIMFPEWT